MMKRFFLTPFSLLVAVTLVTGCGRKRDLRTPEDATATESGGRVEPASESERSILRALDQLPSGKMQTVGRERVTAGAPYFAASGVRCREVSWDKEHRLACREEEGWYFVPNVFGSTQN